MKLVPHVKVSREEYHLELIPLSQTCQPLNRLRKKRELVSSLAGFSSVSVGGIDLSLRVSDS